MSVATSACQMKLPDGTLCGRPVAIFHLKDGLVRHDPKAARCASCRQGGARRQKLSAGKIMRPHGKGPKQW